MHNLGLNCLHVNHVIQIMVFLLLQTKFSCVPSPSAVAGAKFAFVSTSSWAEFVEWVGMGSSDTSKIQIFRKILKKQKQICYITLTPFPNEKLNSRTCCYCPEDMIIECICILQRQITQKDNDNHSLQIVKYKNIYNFSSIY